MSRAGVTVVLGNHSIYRFGVFQFDHGAAELRKNGMKLKLPDQQRQILIRLLQHPGELVSREELRQLLWSHDTFVDFETGLNTAVKRLRDTLGDSADKPTFIETVPRKGYKFIAPVETIKQDGYWVDHDNAKNTSGLATSEKALRSRRHLAFVGLFIGLLLALIIGCYLIWLPTSKQSGNLSIVPFTTFPGFEIAPSFSPDGNQIVFSWPGPDRKMGFDLYIKQVGLERAVQLTHHSAMFLASAWSPDGRFIAFMRQAEPDASGIYIIPALGGEERKLADITPYIDYGPIGLTWSSDSRWVAFAKADSATGKPDPGTEHYRIHLVNAETNEERALPAPSPECVHAWQPAYSPNGKYLASVCVLNWAGVGKIYLQTPDGKQAREVPGAGSSGGFSGIAWTADSASLIYSANQHLWRVPLAGGKPEKLLFAGDAESLSVARAGNRLAYGQVRHPGSIWQLKLASPTKPDGPARKIIASSRGDDGQSMSPDGRHIAFLSWRSGDVEVWISDPDGSNPVQLSSFRGPQVRAPSWSPDNHKIVFDVRASGNAELYVVNLEGGPPKRLVTGTPSAANPSWSSDGRWIYFNTERPDTIWKVPVEGGAPVQLTGEGRFLPQESTDGSRIFYRTADGQHPVWSASVNGGDERPVTGMPSDVDWVLANAGIYFIDGRSQGASPPALNYFEFSTGHVRKIADLPSLPLIGRPTLSSEGHTLLFSGIEQPDSDIVLVEGFR